MKIRTPHRGTRREAEAGGKARRAETRQAARRGQGAGARAHRTAACDAGPQSAERRDRGNLAARDQVRRLPHHGACFRRRGAADHPRRAGLDEALRRPAGRLQKAAVPRRGHRRRDRRARRERHQPLRPAAGCAFARRRQQARLLRLRPPPSRRLESRQGPARKTQGAARAVACRPRHRTLRHPAQRSCRRRRAGALRAGVRAWARRHRLEARFGALSKRPLEDLDQDQGAQRRRLRHRRLHHLPGCRRACRARRSANG